MAAKQFTADSGTIDDNPNMVAQLKAWGIYQKASVEARVMYQLSHPNILGLIGVSLRPLTLLVELAPKGDLKKCIEKFKRSKIKLSRKTLQATLIQVCEHNSGCASDCKLTVLLFSNVIQIHRFK